MTTLNVIANHDRGLRIALTDTTGTTIGRIIGWQHVTDPDAGTIYAPIAFLGYDNHATVLQPAPDEHIDVFHVDDPQPSHVLTGRN